MHTNTHVPPGGTAGKRLPAPRQALEPHQRFETLAVVLCIGILHRLLVRLPRQALPLFCRGFVNLLWLFTRIMCLLDFLLYNPRRYMLSARKTVA